MAVALSALSPGLLAQFQAIASSASNARNELTLRLISKSAGKQFIGCNVAGDDSCVRIYIDAKNNAIGAALPGDVLRLSNWTAKSTPNTNNILFYATECTVVEHGDVPSTPPPLIIVTAQNPPGAAAAAGHGAQNTLQVYVFNAFSTTSGNTTRYVAVVAGPDGSLFAIKLLTPPAGFHGFPRHRWISCTCSGTKENASEYHNLPALVVKSSQSFAVSELPLDNPAPPAIRSTLIPINTLERAHLNSIISTTGTVIEVDSKHVVVANFPSNRCVTLFPSPHMGETLSIGMVVELHGVNVRQNNNYIQLYSKEDSLVVVTGTAPVTATQIPHQHLTTSIDSFNSITPEESSYSINAFIISANVITYECCVLHHCKLQNGTCKKCTGTPPHGRNFRCDLQFLDYSGVLKQMTSFSFPGTTAVEFNDMTEEQQQRCKDDKIYSNVHISFAVHHDEDSYTVDNINIID